jgi:hypothetical protein
MVELRVPAPDLLPQLCAPLVAVERQRDGLTAVSERLNAVSAFAFLHVVFMLALLRPEMIRRPAATVSSCYGTNRLARTLRDAPGG